MSYNLFFKNKVPINSIEIIKKMNPDILIVQELTPNWETKIKDELHNLYPYRALHSLQGTHGLGIYSKYKLSNQIILNNSIHRPYAQIVEIKFKGKMVQIVNSHLASPAIAVENKSKFFELFFSNYNMRKKQIREILDKTLNRTTE